MTRIFLGLMLEKDDVVGLIGRSFHRRDRRERRVWKFIYDSPVALFRTRGGKLLHGLRFSVLASSKPQSALNKSSCPTVMPEFATMDLESFGKIDKPGLLFEPLNRGIGAGLGIVNTDQQLSLLAFLVFLNEP